MRASAVGAAPVPAGSRSDRSRMCSLRSGETGPCRGDAGSAQPTDRPAQASAEVSTLTWVTPAAPIAAASRRRRSAVVWLMAATARAWASSYLGPCSFALRPRRGEHPGGLGLAALVPRRLRHGDVLGSRQRLVEVTLGVADRPLVVPLLGDVVGDLASRHDLGVDDDGRLALADLAADPLHCAPVGDDHGRRAVLELAIAVANRGQRGNVNPPEVHLHLDGVHSSSGPVRARGPPRRPGQCRKDSSAEPDRRPAASTASPPRDHEERRTVQDARGSTGLTSRNRCDAGLGGAQS